MRQKVRPEDIARKHRDNSELSEQECNETYMSFIRQWPLYGSTIFDVLQGYTTTLPKNLWLAVNQYGIHILKRRDKEPLVSYEYKDIVNYRLVFLLVAFNDTCMQWNFSNNIIYTWDRKMCPY